MVWTAPEYSRKRVDQAGNLLYRQPILANTIFRRMLAYGVVNNWRTSHSFPLNTLRIYLGKRALEIDRAALVAQRIKRLSSIETKLILLPWLQLSEMQDMGGCRAVLRSVPQVRRLAKAFAGARFKHKLDDFDDYIANPKRSGYRGIHLIYRYHSDRKPTYNGLKIEIQLRSAAQHAWATAVETVGTFTRQALKSSLGEKDWLRFFALMGSAIARKERSPLVPGTPSSSDALLKELRHCATTLNVVARLQSYGAAIDTVSKGEVKGAHYFLVYLQPDANRVTVTGFKSDELTEATKEYLKTEQKILGSIASAVLVSVESVRSLRRAYPNYFLDTTAFVRAVKEAVDL